MKLSNRPRTIIPETRGTMLLYFIESDVEDEPPLQYPVLAWAIDEVKANEEYYTTPICGGNDDLNGVWCLEFYQGTTAVLWDFPEASIFAIREEAVAYGQEERRKLTARRLKAQAKDGAA